MRENGLSVTTTWISDAREQRATRQCGRLNARQIATSLQTAVNEK
jgi:hypothetical protein